MPAHLEWNNDWQPVHSSSGNPLTPGQYGVQGVMAADWVFVKLQYKNNGPIMNLMNHSDHLFNKTSDHLREKSDRSDSTNEIDNSIHKRHGLLNGDNGNTTNTKADRPKPFVPPKQVLMYLVR